MKRWGLLLALGLVVAGFLPGSGQPSRHREELLALANTILTQLDLAVQQATFASFSVTLREAKAHTKQVLNIAVGRGEPGYDTSVPDLGDGVGLINHVRQLARLIGQTGDAGDYKLTVDNVRFFVQAAVELLRAALGVEEPERARTQVRMAQGLLLAARGASDDLPSEGGIRTLLTFLRAAR